MSSRATIAAILLAVLFFALPSPPAHAVYYVLPDLPADLGWWNGCTPTSAAMLFGWWEEHGADAFPGSHRNVPSSYGYTSSSVAGYNDARGIIASWEHKQAGTALGLTYGSYRNHSPNSLADFFYTQDGYTSESKYTHALKTFAAWDDLRTPEIESRKFLVQEVSAGNNFAAYKAEIDAGRPVLIAWDKTSPPDGHTTLGVGYNDDNPTVPRAVTLTTYKQGPVQWNWDGTAAAWDADKMWFVRPDPQPVPELSAYVDVTHQDIGGLIVEIGVGDPANPAHSWTVWDDDGYSLDDNLVLTDIDVTAALNDALAGDLGWYLKVTTRQYYGAALIESFQVRYGFDQMVYYSGAPLYVPDNSTGCVYLQTSAVPEPGTISLLAACLAVTGVASVIRRHRRANDTRS